MKKPVSSALLTGTLLASFLASPVAAQSSESLCNGLEPTIVGTEGDDTIQGTYKDDVILALGGNDIVRGASGADVICGGAGDDEIYGDSQNDTIFGGAGNDTIYGGSDADEINGGDGNDTIFGNSQNDRLFGNAGDDSINGGPDEDFLDGGPGVDFLDGSWQNDSCVGGESTAGCEDEAPGSVEPAPAGPLLLSEADMAWSQGASEWVNVLWTADGDLANVEVRVTSASDVLEVEYPSDSDRSRLGVDSDLSTSEIDFTAVKLTTTGPGAVSATIDISWDDADGARQSTQFALNLENRVYEGEDFAILTEAVAVGTDVDAPAANWIDLDYKGLAPTNRSMAMTVTGDLPVYHPQDTFTSLHHDQLLHAGEADVARVWFDPELISAGNFTVIVSIDYVDTNGVAKTTSHEVAVTVE